MGFPGAASGKESAGQEGNTGDSGLIPGWVRSPGRRHGSPVQYSCLESSLDRGAWHVTVHGPQRVRHDLTTEHTYHCGGHQMCKQKHNTVPVQREYISGEGKASKPIDAHSI